MAHACGCTETKPAVIVDPMDAEAERFYLKYGFTKIPDSGKLFMTMRKIEEAFQKGEPTVEEG